MRKNILYAMLAVGVMASCSKDAYVDNPGGNGNSDDGALPIQISAAPATVDVGVGMRSVGSVGADGGTTPNNLWSGQMLTLFAFPKDIGTEQTVITNDPSKCPFFAKNAIAATGTVAGTISWADNNAVYFPRNGAYDFFGYHSDGAVKETPTYNGTNAYSAPFKIDGSQDLMYAKAMLTDQQKQALGSDANKAFSSYTARRDIQPSMTFNHLLTRFTFKLKAAAATGNPNQVAEGADEVYVRSVKVLSKNSGTFVVISNSDIAAPLKWNPELELLTLQERTADKKAMQTLDAVRYNTQNQNALYAGTHPNYTYLIKSNIPSGNITTWLGRYPATLAGNYVGESLLVAPDNEYTIEVEVMQYYDGAGNMILPPANKAEWYKEGDQRYYKFTKVIKASDMEPKATTFAASTSYNVSITIYGLQKVDLNAVLGKWNDGGNTEWSPEDDDFLNNNK